MFRTQETGQWVKNTRAAARRARENEALDSDTIRATMPSPPISGSAAADRIAAAVATPNPTAYGEKQT
ncbi:hypothetical protein ACF1FX_35930 [Streptomyces sp. NPDC014646]|uniref:hypothetical protein n=1 Tax=Streptomyces sp. NPDC014646 TaxID=3364877 RepID=UPI0036F521B4